MQRLLLYVGLFAISSFINAAADEHVPTLYIVWKMGISGQLSIPGNYAAPINVPFVPDSVAEKPTYTFIPRFSHNLPIEVRFYRAAETDDLKKKYYLQPMWHIPTKIDVHAPQINKRCGLDGVPKRASWKDLPDGTRIVLRYSEATKVAATIKLALNVTE